MPATVLIALLLLLASCAPRARESGEAIYLEAKQLQRAGNLEGAVKLIDNRLPASSNREMTPVECKLRLLKSELLQSLGRDSESAKLRDASIPNSAEYSEALGRQRMDQGWAVFMASDNEGARVLLDEAAAIAEQNHHDDPLAFIEQARGNVLIRLGNPSEAEAHFRASLRLAQRLGDSYLQASVHGSLGFLAMDAARYDEAIGYFEQTVKESKAKSLLARTKQNLGWCYYRLGDIDRALVLFQESEQLSGEMGRVAEQQIAMGHIGSAYYAKNDFRAARANYERALGLARRVNNIDYQATWLNNLATTSLELGDVEAAERYNSEVMNIREDQRRDATRLWSVINAARIHQQRSEFSGAEKLYRQAAAAASDDPAPRLDASERLADMLVSQKRVPEADNEFRGVLTLIDDSRAKLERDDSRLSYFSSVIRVHQKYVDFLYGQNRPDDALLAAESSRARLLSQRLHPDREGPAPGNVKRWQRVARGTGRYLLSYWLGSQQSILWVITPERILSFRLPVEAEIRRLVESHTKLMFALRDPLEDDASPARKLYDVLLKPAEASIPVGARVMIVPDGCLHDLNFETLVSQRGKPHYWIDDVIITVIPSLGMLLDSKAAPRRKPALLLIGDPLPAGDQKFPKLANASRELAFIRGEFAGSEIVVRTGAAARPSAYRDALPGQFTIIHFAAHGVANRESPLDSAVILTPGEGGYKLYARDIIREPIDPDLVTISSCRSAGARTYGGEGLVGFAWAFLEAGARGVVAGLWEVDDASTATIMERMYRNIHSGVGTADALRTAKLSLLHGGGVLRKPYYWAPFQVFAASL